MFAEDGLIGCPYGVQNMLEKQNKLSWKVVERINESQELTMMNVFCHQSNESFIKKCLDERIAEIKSWHWVLKDLSKRLDDSIAGLKYEENAVLVIIERLRDEVEVHSQDLTMPGALCPLSDPVEESIVQEHKYLKDQSKLFDNTLEELRKQINIIQKIKKKIETDILRKQKAIDIDERVVDDPGDCKKVFNLEKGKKKKNRATPLSRWEKKCSSLKSLGLQALTNAVVLRLQIRGSRTRLSIGAQANASRVDVALKRRHHANRVKLDELIWQKNEIIKDVKILDEELYGTEKTLVDNLNHISKIEGRMVERSLKPSGEHTSDDVNKGLRTEITSLRKFIKDLRGNIKRINALKMTLIRTITKLDHYIEDLVPIIELDAKRMRGRLNGSQGQPRSQGSSGSIQTSYKPVEPSAPPLPSFKEQTKSLEDHTKSLPSIQDHTRSLPAIQDHSRSSGPGPHGRGPLAVIPEEDDGDDENLSEEEDDYPFDY